MMPVPKRKQPGAPAWIVTFADLMSLLLTFFVLLLSFSTFDEIKYRALLESLSNAFGESVIEIFSAPKPVSVIDFEAQPDQGDDNADEEQPIEDEVEVDPQPLVALEPPNTEELASVLATELQKEIEDESLNVSFDKEKVVIRFSEKATFPSGSEELKPKIIPIIEKIVGVLSKCEGNILVSGHTDNQPITTGRFRSNWDLASARAVSVVHELVLSGDISADKVTAAGHAETLPLAPNDTAENRSKNRRVELRITDPNCEKNMKKFFESDQLQF